MNAQLGFNLQPLQPFSLAYFVPHSGVAPSVQFLEQTVSSVKDDPTSFISTYLFGPNGCGKQHLAEGFALRAKELGVAPENVSVVAFPDVCEQDDCTISQFVSRYEELRASGGLLFSHGRSHPDSLTMNPHLRSRLLAGRIHELSYPREEELRPLLRSLSERRNLRLSERAFEYLVRRIPLDPLSFDAIFDKVDRISLTEGRPAGLTVVRQALEGERGKHGANN